MFTRILAVMSGAISLGMLLAALFSWRSSGAVGALIWLLGAAFFGFVARHSWRSKAGLSDVDFTG
jgi:hypothetical protein